MNKNSNKSIIVLLILITVSIFLKILVGYNKYIIPSDVYTQVYPWINENLNIVGNLNLPLWSDNMFGGYPIFQDPQHSVFYIFHYILLFFKNENILLYMIQIIAIIQFFVLAIATYLVGQELNMSKVASLLTSLTFSFGGFVLSHIQHFCSMETLKYLSIIILYILKFYKNNKKSNLFFITICLTLSIFAGSVQIIIYNTFFIFLFNIYLGIKNKDYQKCIRVILHIILGIVIAGIQIIPTLELSYNSVRSELTYEQFSKNSNNIRNLSTMFFPFLYTNEFIRNYSTPINSLYYIGIIPIILFIFSILNTDKKVIKLLIIILILYLLSLGKNTIIHEFMYNVPIFNKFQRSVNWWFYVQFLISILIGYSFDKLIKNKSNNNYYLGLLIFTALIICGYIVGIDKNLIKEIDIFVIFNIVICFISVLIFILFFKEKISNKIFGVIVISVLAIDIIFNSYNNTNLIEKLDTDLSVFSNNIFDMPSSMIDIIKENLENGERIHIREMQNTGGLLNESTIAGYNPLVIRRYTEFINMFETTIDYRVIDVNNFNTNLLDFMSVKYIVDNKYSEELANNENYKLIYQNENAYLYENINYLPRFYFTQKTTNSTSDEILINISRLEYNPQLEVYGENLKNKEYKISENANIEILEKESNYIKLKVINDDISYIGTTEIMYDGWKVKINGNEKNIDTINYIFRGIEVEAGENIVEFYYEPKSLIIGSIFSIIGVVILMICVLYNKRSERDR